MWCRRERSKTVDGYWNNVIFSDECKVEIGTDRRVYIWRKIGEEWEPSCIDPPPGRRLSVMIWGCITYNGIGTLCFVEGNINAEKYINIIDTNLWPVIARHFPQDNCVSRRQCTRTSGTYSQRVHSGKQYKPYGMAYSKSRPKCD